MPTRRITGAAALAYAIGAAIENMELLGAPPRGAAAPEIRSAVADRALAIVTSSAGAVSLVAYVVFVAGIYLLLRGVSRWPAVVLCGGLAGPALGAAGLALYAVVVGGGVSDGATSTLYDLHLQLRLGAGGFMALFLGATGVAALRSGGLPRPLGVAACIAAPALLVGPVAAVTGGHGLAVVAAVAFGLHSLWIWLTGLWLTVGGDVAPTVLLRRAAFLVLVLAAGLIGLAMLAVPRATGSFFAWGLAPEGLAAFAGGVYVGSAVVYAIGLRASWHLARGLVLAAVVLSVSVLAITLVHLDVFDFDRLQAWAWVALFAGFSVITSGLLVLGGPATADRGEPLEPWTRGAFAAVAAALAAAGASLWVDPDAVVDLPPLGGRFAGSWIVMLAVLAGWAAVRGRRDEARLPALALVALPAGALVAALRSSAAPDHVAALVALTAVGLVLLRSAHSAPPRSTLSRNRLRAGPGRA
jgi:hypothetical protein